jgi:beta-lactamase regulating signal transducer with metallopeptidase domain
MIAWMLETMVSATLLMLLVLAVRKPVAELFGAQWAYALWLLPVLLPLLPVPAFLPSTAAPVTIIIPDMPLESAVAAAPAPEPGGSNELLLMLLALWAGGAVAFAAWQQSTYSAFMLHLGPEGRQAQPPSFGGIRVVESDAVDGPVAVGLFRRRIVVPIDFLTRYSETERRLALEHELVHHRRFDLLWNWIGLGFLTINWFNPIVHIAFRAFRADQELACDATVTSRAPAERHDYACALVKSASHPGLIAVCPLNHAAMLKRRLRMMKKHRASWTRTAGGAAALSLVGAAGLALATPGFAHEERAAAPAELLVNAGGQAPIIARQDVERLREKCASGEERRGAIVCSSAESRDPEVRAIVEKTRKRVKERVAQVRLDRKATKLDRKEMAEIRKSVAKARVEHRAAMKEAHKALAESRVQMFRVERGEHRAEIERALAHARIHIDRMKAERPRIHAMRMAMVPVRVHLPRHVLTPEQVSEIKAAMAKAQKEIERIEIDIDPSEIEEEVERDLERELERDRDPEDSDR